MRASTVSWALRISGDRSAGTGLITRKTCATRKSRAATPEGNLKRNLTIAIETDLVKKARVIAARRETSLSRMLAGELKRLVAEDEGYDRARRKAVAHLRSGFALGGKVTSTRGQWHER